MNHSDNLQLFPRQFTLAKESIALEQVRNEITVYEIPAPGNLAPFSIAYSADVFPKVHGQDSELGSGRFILLFNPEAPESWGSNFRVVCFAQAPLDTDTATDPFISSVAWSWLKDSLSVNQAEHIAASGTATRMLSTGFGELAAFGDGAKLEMRASWSPTTVDIGNHILAWTDFLATIAGLPPKGSDADSLTIKRNSRA